MCFTSQGRSGDSSESSPGLLAPLCPLVGRGERRDSHTPVSPRGHWPTAVGCRNEDSVPSQAGSSPGTVYTAALISGQVGPELCTVTRVGFFPSLACFPILLPSLWEHFLHQTPTRGPVSGATPSISSFPTMRVLPHIKGRFWFPSLNLGWTCLPSGCPGY